MPSRIKAKATTATADKANEEIMADQNDTAADTGATEDTAAPMGGGVSELGTEAETPIDRQEAADLTDEDTGEDDDTAADEDAADWDVKWVVGVSPRAGTKADKANVAAFSCVVHRTAKGTYTASKEATQGVGGSSAKVAVNNLLRALKLVPVSDYDIDGLDNEPKAPDVIGDNAATAKLDPWLTEGPSKKALDDAATKMAEADDTITFAEGTVRDGYLTMGRAAADAWTVFGTFTEDGGVNLTQWGRWLKGQHMPGGILFGRERISQNTVSEARDMASAPAAFLSLMPSDLNSPKSFQKWSADLRNGFSAIVAERLHKAKEAEKEEDDTAPVVASNGDLSNAAHQTVGMIRDRIDADRTKAAASAAAANKDPQKPQVSAESFLTPATRRDIAMVAMFDWLAADMPKVGTATFDSDFAAHRLGKSLVKAWKAAIDAAPKRTEPKAETDPGDTGEDTAPRGFADLTIPQAAVHIATLLASRSDAEDVDAILAEVERILTAKANAAEAAADKAEQKGEEAATE